MTQRELVFVAVGASVAGALVAVLPSMLHDVPRPVPEPAPEFDAVDAPVAALVERLRAAGEPTTLREVVERDAPRGMNAADSIWLAAMTLHAELELKSISGDAARFWPFDGADSPESETPENLTKLAALLPRLEETCDSVTKALEAPRCRFPFEECDAPENVAKLVPGAARTVAAVKAFAEGHEEAAAEFLNDPVDPVFARFRNNSARLTVRKALAGVAAASPNEERRLEACRALLLLGRRDEATSLPDLMGDREFVVSGAEMLRHGLERGALHAAAARSTLDGLLHGSVLDRLPSVLPGERAWLIDQHRSLVIANWDLAQRGRLAPTIVEQCEAMWAIAALRPSPPRDYLSRIDEIAARGGPAAAALPYAARKLLRCDGATRLARVALAAAEYRATHGDFPASLDELRPMFADGVALDPFTDAPFVYERTEAGVRIASAGRLADEATVDEATLRDRCLVWELKR